MHLKRGGGNHLQAYDKTNGQYKDEEAAEINENDKKALAMLVYFGLDDHSNLKFHFPNPNIHDAECCTLFIMYIRKYLYNFAINENKMNYLLSKNNDRDKSMFLNKLGYTLENANDLYRDIYLNTNFDTLEYSEFKKGFLKCIAKTVLKGKLVATIWVLDEDFTLRFVTLIPGGDKIWK